MKYATDKNSYYSQLYGKTILITGGSGSFGRALAIHLLKYEEPERIIIYSRGEHAQEKMARDLKKLDVDNKLRFRIGDVRDIERLKRAFTGVDFVVHAAAMKVVPLCELDPEEAIKTNIIGSMNVVDAALYAGVHKVMALSTDKAAAASTLYGSTKHCAERMFVASNIYGAKFSAVRYGNVAGSQGSVIPLFKKLVADGAKSLPITDPRMTRFFWEIEEAVGFTLSSMQIAEGGEVFIPKIKAYRIIDIAKRIGPDCELEFVGIRGNEKLHEILISEDEANTTLDLGDRYVIEPTNRCWSRTHLDFLGPVRVPQGFKYCSDVAHLVADHARDEETV